VAAAILVLDHDEVSRQALCRWLREEHYDVVTPADVERPEVELNRGEGAVLLLDLDSVAMAPSSIHRLRRRYPRLSVIVLSSRSFHPELASAMRNDIYACLRKPLDQEELLYWLQTLCKGGFSSRDSPAATEPDR